MNLWNQTDVTTTVWEHFNTTLDGGSAPEGVYGVVITMGVLLLSLLVLGIAVYKKCVCYCKD